jgi:hypothetical protein
MRIIALAALIGLAGCSDPRVHQDRPGGTDYVPFAYNQPYQTPPYEQVARARRDCDYGNRTACNWIGQRNW